MQQIETTGKTIEGAIEKALQQLNAKREDVDVKILCEGGFLKKAKVLVSLSQEEQEKPKTEEIKKVEDLDDDDFIHNLMTTKMKLSDFDKKEPQQEEVEEPQTVDKEQVNDKEEQAETEPQPQTETKVNLEDVQGIKPQKTRTTPEEFLKGLLEVLGLDGTISKQEDAERVTYQIDGEGLSELIGKRGECLNNLSYLLSVICRENHKKLSLDVENYKERRKQSLEKLAVNTADKVAKTGRYAKLEPMPAYERRIIHLKLQDDKRVTTLSKGEEPRRYLMIFPVGEDK